MSEDKDLTLLNHDQQLAADLKAGKVTMDEVQRIWDLTSDLSAQAPINVRRAMIAIRAAETPEQKVHLAMQFMMSAATEIQAAMTRDESKFAHLVAGTESIVKALQNVNPIAHRLERIEALVDGLGEMVERKFEELTAKMGNPPITDAVSPEVQPCDHDYPMRDNRCLGCGVLLYTSKVEEAIPDADAEPDAARVESIGSAWAKPADQGPLYVWECPNEECGFTYLSGRNQFDVIPMEHFYCYTHNLPLQFSHEAQSEDRANFARQILKHT